MASLNGFNANEVEPAVGFDPIPAGKYLAAITESEMKPTKAGTGQYLQLTFQVLEGQYKGRLLWARLNLDNPSDMAVKIAKSELSAICRAVGVLTPKDSIELHNLPMTIKVELRERGDTGAMTNEIKGYEARQQAASPAMNTATTGSTPPWKR